MSLGNWSQKYSVNNAIIDEQHKRLMHILFRMELMVNRGKQTDDMVQLLTEMSDYAKEHFKSEERYMERIHYPQLEKHKELHSNYAIQVLQFTLAHLDEAKDNPREVLNFLTHWWTDHILKVDMDYSKHAEKQFVAKL
ncbi:MAG: bacteriohemerythrin [Flavobacteriales bacterium]|nr:bacteriohemerythrin [Flavobacteriales bacterium]